MTGTLRSLWSAWLRFCERAGDLILAGALVVTYFVLLLIPGLWYSRAARREQNDRDSCFADVPAEEETCAGAGEMG